VSRKQDWRPPQGEERAEARRAARLKETHARIKDDFKAIQGRAILVSELTGYIGDDYVDFFLSTPATVRVDATAEDELFHQVDRDWIDPYWNLELLEPHPELEGARSLWMFGTSYNLDGVEVQAARFQWPASSRPSRER
jgi:hypothetical protein